MNKMIVPFFALVLVGCGGPTYKATLSGANEKPNAVTTNGAGNATAVLDGTVLEVSGSYQNLSGAATSAHIHGTADANNNASVVCSLTITESATAGTGTIAGNCDTATITALTKANLDTNMYYVNIHTAANAAGEIRGQLLKQ